MILELLVNNIPHQKINKNFSEFLFEAINLKTAHLVHHQQEDNKKVLLLRLNDPSKYKMLQGMKLTYEEIEIEFEVYERPIIQKINNKLKEREVLISQGKADPENEEISRIYLSNVPKYLKEPELKKIMSKFGNVVSVSIPRNGKIEENSPKQKCRFAVVQFETFEEAVKVFFLDKIKIRDKKIKIKLYIHEGKTTSAKGDHDFFREKSSQKKKKTKDKVKEEENVQDCPMEDNSSRKSLEEEERRWELVKQQRNNLKLDGLIFKNSHIFQNQWIFNSYSNQNYSDGNGSFFYGHNPHFNLFQNRCGARHKNFLDSHHQNLYTEKVKKISQKVEIGEKCFKVRKGLKMAKLGDLHFDKNLRINFPLIDIEGLLTEEGYYSLNRQL